MGFFTTQKERNSKSEVKYCVQVIRNKFSNEMVKEICAAEFNKPNAKVEEVILINSLSAKQVLHTEKWPFSIKTDGYSKVLYIAYACEKCGVMKIDCLVVPEIEADVEDDIAANNGIIRITKDDVVIE